jgi:hypothetical protein
MSARERPPVWNVLAIDDDDLDYGNKVFQMEQDVDPVCPGTTVVQIDDVAVFFGWKWRVGV